MLWKRAGSTAISSSSDTGFPTMLGAQGCSALSPHPWGCQNIPDPAATPVQIGRISSRRISADALGVYTFRAPGGRKKWMKRTRCFSETRGVEGAWELEFFLFKFLVLDTLSVLSSNTPDRQNPTQGSSVKTGKSASVQEARALSTAFGACREVGCRQRSLCPRQSQDRSESSNPHPGQTCPT